jgi:hypothetical protein
MELVQSSPTPERQLFSEQGLAEYFNQRPTDNKVLLYLVTLRPGSLLLPFGDIGTIDQRSGSTSVLTKTCQRLFFLAPLIRAHGIRGVGMGCLACK